MGEKRRFPLFWLVLIALLGAGVAVLHVWRTAPDRLPLPIYDALNTLQTAAPQVTEWTDRVTAPLAQLARPKAENPPAPAAVSADQLTLRLRNGGVVTGELVRRTADTITLRWEYGDVTFHKDEVAGILKGRRIEGEQDIVPVQQPPAGWPHAHDVVFRLMNGTMLDARLETVEPDRLVFVQELEGGGRVEQTIPRADLDTVLFRPIDNERSQQIRTTLEEIFPNMRWEAEGLFTIVSDSIPPVVADYRQTIRELSTEWYLTFFPLLRDRVPAIQQHIVIFDDWGDYIEYAITDGVPGWLAVGYFSPQDEVLYGFNMLGERFSDLLYAAFLQSQREVVDQAVNQATGIVGSRYEIFLEGLGDEIKKKVETAYAQLRQFYGAMTTDTLRHEMTHALFNNWRVQTVVLSAMAEADPERAAKKREFLEADNPAQKRELLLALLNREAQEAMPELQAANSWIVEGTAAFMEVSPIGAPNSGWLSTVQEAQRAEQLLPVEFLNVFKMGSFPRVDNQARLYAYGQSWALVHFLMQRHREGFLRFLDRMARERADEEGEELSWLLEAVGRELRPLDGEFRAYLAEFPPADPPWLEQKQILLDLRTALRSP